MSDSSPMGLARGHPSRWVRFVIRTLSIRGASWWILALALFATLFVCKQAWESERESRKMQFESDAAVLQDAMFDRLNRYVQMLQGLRGLFAASETVEEAEFRAYVNSLDYHRDYPGIVSMEYIQWVERGSELHDMELRFTETPATFMASKDFNPCLDPLQRETAEMACDTATVRLSPMLESARTPDGQAAVLYKPVYRNGSKPTSTSERRENLEGWVFITFLSSELMNEARRTSNSRLDYELFDGDSPSPDRLLCRSWQGDGAISPAPFNQQCSLLVFNQAWTLCLRAPEGAVGTIAPISVELLGAGGVVISLLLFGIAQAMASTGQRALKLATGMTEELHNQKKELQHSQSRLQSALAELSASHAHLEKTQLELIQAAKLESVGTLAAGVAHEVKNPLQIILMGLDYLDHRFPAVEEDTRDTLRDMRDAALRADAITTELLNFSTATEFNACPTDLEEIIERSIWMLKTELNRAGVVTIRDLAGGLPLVMIDAPKIQQVLINLISNALQAMNHQGSVTITTTMDRLEHILPDQRLSHCPLDPSEEVVILKVCDSGPGIPEDLLPKIFDPFFTTKSVGKGAGLGLAIVNEIIDLHGGCIHIQNSPNGGAEVILAFAIAPKT